MSIGKLTTVSARPDHVIELGWDDGLTARLDLAQLLERRAVLAPLRNSVEFSQARLSADGWSLEWPCGIDFGAPQLRRWALDGLDDRAAA